MEPAKICAISDCRNAVSFICEAMNINADFVEICYS